MDFEKKLGQLEKIVQKMEGGELNLDEALKSFESGVKLSRECQSSLDEAELKVKKTSFCIRIWKSRRRRLRRGRVMSLLDAFEDEILFFEENLQSYFLSKPHLDHGGFQSLMESVQYSLSSGGKRFRPLLSLLTARALGKPLEQALPVALAVEFIHTYSLIHDDLPCMDNDDLRRGKPTNHKVYGEGMALLAGDALLTESLFLLADRYKENPAVATEVIWLVSEASGVLGMVGGQAMDVQVPEEGHTQEQVQWIHQMKTGALIRVSVESAAVACGATPAERERLRKFADLLGYAFQLADDIDDYEPSNPEPTSIINILGLDQTRKALFDVTEKALKEVDLFNARELHAVAQFNLDRVSPVS